MLVLKKSWALALFALILGSSLPLISTPASARDHGGAVAAGVIGGLAAGTVLGATIANPGPYGEYYEDVYDVPPTRCWRQKDRVPMYDAWGNFTGYQVVVRRVCDQ